MHADSVIVHPENSLKSKVCLIEGIHCPDGRLKGGIVHNLFHLRPFQILGLPYVLVWTKLTRINPEEISLVPRIGVSLFNMDGDGIESRCFYVYIT